MSHLYVWRYLTVNEDDETKAKNVPYAFLNCQEAQNWIIQKKPLHLKKKKKQKRILMVLKSVYNL